MEVSTTERTDFDVVVIGGGPVEGMPRRSTRRRPGSRSPSPNSTRWEAPAGIAGAFGQGVPRDGQRRANRGRCQGVRRAGGTARRGLRRQSGPEAKGRRSALQGPRRADEGSGHHHVLRYRHAPGGRRGEGLERRRDRELTVATSFLPLARCRAPCPASTSTAASWCTLPTRCSALERLPRPSVAVIGGGAIGCEFASMFADLGSPR